MSQFIDQFKTDWQQFWEELSWKRLKRLAKDPVELRSYTSVYLVLSGVLFLTTAIASYDEFSSVNVLKDHSRRAWKDWINEYKQIGLTITGFKKEDAMTAINEDESGLGNKIVHLQSRFIMVQDSVSVSKDYNDAKVNYIKYFNLLKTESTHLSDLKAADAESYYFYSDALKKNDFEIIKIRRAELDALKDSIVASTQKIADLRNIRDTHKNKVNELEDLYLNIDIEIQKLTTQLNELSKDSLRYAETKVEIKQISLVDYTTNNFYDLESQVDRCQSCHVAWNDSLFNVDSKDPYAFKGDFDSKENEKRKLPTFYKKISYKEFVHMHHKYHPPLTVEEFYALDNAARQNILEHIVEEYPKSIRFPKPSELAGDLSDKLEVRMDPFQYHSPEIMKVHNLNKMGCVSCHHGQGRALDVGEAHSRPHEPGYDHYWESPLLQGKYVEASCQSCHPNSVDLPHGETVSLGRKLVMDLGCWGCHQIPVQDHFNLRKVGPQLNALMAKTTSSFVYRWVKNPKNFYAHTRMPNFYLSDEEALSITAYLKNLSASSDYKPLEYPGEGDVENGKKLVFQTGCTACHSVGKLRWENMTETPALREGPGYAPSLDKIGSKTNANWVYDWVLNPKKYSHDTRMPNMRLNENEAADITAYLMTLKEKDSVTFIRGFDENVLSDKRLIEIGSRLIEQKGCYGCHDLKEHNKFANVSVSLAEMADKNAHNLDFGNSMMGNRYHHAHSWEGWVKGKIRDPRQYQTDRIPLSMPNFGLNEKEVEAIAVAIKGWTKHEVADQYQSDDIHSKKDYYTGQFFFRDNNCIGCHEIEGAPGSGYIRTSIAKEWIEGLDPYGYGNDLAYAPPILAQPGDRYQEQWLLKFFHDPTLGDFGIRPNFKVRMPNFEHSDSTWNTVIKYFAQIDGHDFKLKQHTPPPTTPEKLALGKDLVAKFDCQKCHAMGGENKDAWDSKYAPDLRWVHAKLKPGWTHKWLGDPQGIIKGTKMLPNWGNGYVKVDFPDADSASGKSINEQARHQGEAVRDYIYTLRQEYNYHKN